MEFRLKEEPFSEKKQKIVDLIKEHNPKDTSINKYATWIEGPEDIKDDYLQAVTEDDTIETGITPDFTAQDIQKALATNTITIYSTYPIKIGTFVTPSRMLAVSYGNKTPYSKTVPLEHVAWIDGEQG